MSLRESVKPFFVDNLTKLGNMTQGNMIGGKMIERFLSSCGQPIILPLIILP